MKTDTQQGLTACVSVSRGNGATHTIPELGFLDDARGEWVGGQWIPAATAAELEAERAYDRFERKSIAELGGG